MRLYFHLTRCDEVLRDQEGVEVVDLHTASRAIVLSLDLNRDTAFPSLPQ
jgi:hypothetical protein